MTSTAAIILPWLIFSVYYMFTSWRYAQFVIPNLFFRGIFDFCQLIIFILTTHSNVYFFITSLFDILNYPDYHSSLTTKLAVYGCIAYSIDVVCSYFFLPSIWKKLKWRKILCCFLSWVFSLAFGLLYYVGDCFAHILPMDLCFLWTSEDYCFSMQDATNSAMTILRYYPNCRFLNFARGVIEYLDLLTAMSYMSFLRGDIIIEQYEMCKWMYMSKSKGTTRRNSLSAIEDEKERLEVIRKENEAVKDLIENFNNPFLLKYIKQYWEDYDSVQSNEAIGRSFQQLTERELNQLQQESSCHVC